jgi:hypothetical protein
MPWKSSTPTCWDPYHGIFSSVPDVRRKNTEPSVRPANPCYHSRKIKIHDMQERDTVDNRTVYLNQDLPDLSLHEVGVCFRACREDDCHNGGSSDRLQRVWRCNQLECLCVSSYDSMSRQCIVRRWGVWRARRASILLLSFTDGRHRHVSVWWTRVWRRDAGLGLRCIHHSQFRNLSKPAFCLHFQAISSLT